MPTSTEFDIAARAFTGASEDLRALVGTSRPHIGPDVVEGGLLSMLVQDTLTLTDNNLMLASRMLSSLAARAQQRAEVCRTYASTMDAYYRATGQWSELVATLPDAEFAPPGPRRPPNPPYWVSR